MSKKWTDEERREAWRLYQSGMSWREVGQHFGVSSNAARHATRDTRADEPTESSHPQPPRFPDWIEPEVVDWRDWFDAWDKTLELHKRIDPSQAMLTIDFSRMDRPLAIALASDLHMGGGFTNHKAIRQTIEYILDTPDLYLGITGDSIEGFIPGMKPAETVEQQTASVKSQIKALNSLVKELGSHEKLLWMTWGDHDAKWFEQAIGLNVIKNEVHDRVPYFTGRGLIRLMVGEEEYWVMVNHAERFRSQWNKVHPARRQYERFFPADVNVVCHTHKPAFMLDHHYEQLREAGLNVGGKHWLVQCGTYKTGPDPYTVRSWTPGVIGVPTVVFQPDTHDSDVLESPAKAMAFLRGLEAA